MYFKVSDYGELYAIRILKRRYGKLKYFNDLRGKLKWI